MGAGVIAEVGNHDSLSQKEGGLYSKLVARLVFVLNLKLNIILKCLTYDWQANKASTESIGVGCYYTAKREGCNE
jgi:hypothetical protein